MITTERVSIVIPAYDEEKVIASVVSKAKDVLEREKINHEIIVINDGSHDNTASEAAKAGAIVYSRPTNYGNGASIKYGIRKATGDYIVLMDGDGQHNPNDIPRMLKYLPDYEMVVGARTSESEGEIHRNLANRLYNIMASYVVGSKVDDLTSGFRALNAAIAKKIVYLFPNGYSYTSTSTITIFRMGYGVKYVPIKASARIGRSKIKLIRDGIRFLMIILRIGASFAPSRIYIPIALLVFLPGFFYALYRLITSQAWTLPIVISITAGLLFLILGLISEQISKLRMKDTE